MTIKNWVRTGTACAALAGALYSTAAFAADFTFADVHYWVGEGTNRAVILVDYDFRGRQEGFTNSLAYGVRWNGQMTQLEALQAIAQEDRRLHFSTYSSWGSSLPESIAYDRDGDGGAFALENASKTDPDDLVQSCNSADGWNFYWATVEKPGSTFSDDFAFCMLGVAAAPMIPGGYFGMMFLPWGDTLGNALGTYDAYWNPLPFVYPETGDWIDFVPSPPVAAESPYGHQVVSYRADTSEQFAQGYANPQAALGRPAAWGELDTEDPDAGVAPITPFIPATTREQLVRLYDVYDDFDELEERANITIAFDHPVVDDPNNPWGLDFIVFGNALYTGTSGDGLTGVENPEDVAVVEPPYGQADILNVEPGRVSVSQDGVTWYAFSQGPLADGFAPTLGFRYDLENPDASLFEGNAWWGAPADPTYPVPPAAAANIGLGTTLAQIATWYDGSAGGTAFDIGSLALPATRNGRKWFKYVRIVNQAPEDDPNSSCEIDAVADVYPDTPYGLYAKARYSWTELASSGVKTALAGNGRPNFVNFCLGEAPAANLQVTDFEVRDGRIWFSFPVWRPDWTLAAIQESGIDFGVRAAGKLSASGIVGNPFGWPRFDGVTALPNGSWKATMSVPELSAKNAFFRLAMSAEETPSP